MPERLRGLPVFLAMVGSTGCSRYKWRGRRDRRCRGRAEVTYRELADLSHCYPREINAEILNWLRGEQ